MKILIADDQKELRSAMGLAISQQDGMEVIAEAADAAQMLRAAATSRPDVIMLDLDLPGLPGLLGEEEESAVCAIKRHCPDCRVIAMSSYVDAADVVRLSGADGFVSKSESPDAFIKALFTIKDRIETEGGSI